MCRGREKPGAESTALFAQRSSRSGVAAFPGVKVALQTRVPCGSTRGPGLVPACRDEDEGRARGLNLACSGPPSPGLCGWPFQKA